jgi:hypothetical protein
MSKITRIDEGKRRFAEAPGPFARRRVRLERRLLRSRAPIVWLCAGAGSGKSRLIEAVQQTLTERGWSLLDDPPALRGCVSV